MAAARGNSHGVGTSREEPTAVTLRELEVRDFRCFHHVVVAPEPRGLTVLSGPNGSGKTSLLEAVAYLGTLRSFRGSPREAMITTGADSAVVRGRVMAGDRELLVEAELARSRRSRVQLNRRAVTARRPLAEALPVSVFSPDDLSLLQGPPGQRRELLDRALSLLHPELVTTIDEFERCVRQRNAVLRQALRPRSRRSRESDEGPDVPGAIEATLAVWDERTARAGGVLWTARRALLERLGPSVSEAYQCLAGLERNPPPAVDLLYRTSWRGDLEGALAAARREDLVRGTTTVGPHHDDLTVALEGRDARHQASQGEQRCLALALRVGVHRLVTSERGLAPLLLLDDVLSELDPGRAAALVRTIPAGQTLLSTASPLPPGVPAAAVIDVAATGTRSTGPSTGASGAAPG